MFGRHYNKRSTFLPFVIFRLLLSLIIFVILMGGLYSALQYFSGVDPLKADPRALGAVVITAIRNPTTTLDSLSKMDFNSLFALSKQNQIIQSDNSLSLNPGSSDAPVNKPVNFSFLLVADSHNENNYLEKALQQGKQKAKNLQFVIGLGDYTDVGTVSELKNTKQFFDMAGLRYFLVPGDHDLWDARDKKNPPAQNFETVFGKTSQSFIYSGAKFILFDNADNYNGVLENQMQWLSNELNKAKLSDNVSLIFGFTHKPLYHPSSDHVMGMETPALKDQAKKIISLLKDASVNEIFAGDIHYFTRYIEPISGLKMTTLGAVASAKNTQAPRYAVVTVYEDGTYGVEDVEIK
ncbi:MAG: metallophosphoesterase family protein [Candidatus Daviesbacteria bacterium]|nr:metallophosphoesterase family protein [Candidatus Daviesbacteria bacterium]